MPLNYIFLLCSSDSGIVGWNVCRFFDILLYPSSIIKPTPDNKNSKICKNFPETQEIS